MPFPTAQQVLPVLPKPQNGPGRNGPALSAIEDKEMKKKLRNRESALAARERKKQKMLELERRVAELSRNNSILKMENCALRGTLTSVMQKYGAQKSEIDETLRLTENVTIKKEVLETKPVIQKPAAPKRKAAVPVVIKQEIDAGFSEPCESDPPPIKLPKVTLTTGTPTTATTTATVNGKVIRKQVVLAFNPFKLGTANIKRCQIATAAPKTTTSEQPISIHQSSHTLNGHNSRVQPVARRMEMSNAGSGEQRVSPVIATAQVNLDKLQAQGAQIQAHKTATPNNQQVKQEPDNQPQISAGHNNQNNNTNFNKFDGSDVGTPEHASSPSTSSESVYVYQPVSPLWSASGSPASDSAYSGSGSETTPSHRSNSGIGSELSPLKSQSFELDQLSQVDTMVSNGSWYEPPQPQNTLDPINQLLSRRSPVTCNSRDMNSRPVVSMESSVEQNSSPWHSMLHNDTIISNNSQPPLHLQQQQTNNHNLSQHQTNNHHSHANSLNNSQPNQNHHNNHNSQNQNNQLSSQLNSSQNSASDFFSSSEVPSSDLESSLFQNSPFSDDFSVLFGLS
ncbi:Oidioi.mRNA.OKI2018_I69.PAR.g12857.t1.cds [Oikopleura dioica]|uniref:Oidioi.mRNA.OKI2018_I69.PAR.g12857.t1.cds n=1 Tax=Oikopleura dioica TaxID=34765 RepID=A0ABN7S1Z5_OIKDI|nr:Oidioi.mRNA.OKI2018_I69.PAR.g12857.t1.cds [Oikopleura dioica]